MNILCGPNSIGKTTVIESVATMFMNGEPTVKRNVACSKGELNVEVEIDGQIKSNRINVMRFNPREQENTGSFVHEATKLLSIKVGRSLA